MQELLASYYGMQRGVDRSSDVESTKFDVKSYVKGLLKNDKVETLLRKDESMVRRRPPAGERRSDGSTCRVQ